jgi:hypothetical protein
MASRTTHGPWPAGGAPAILEPERPRRRRTDRSPARAASSPTALPSAPLRRAGPGRAARPAAGHHIHRSMVLSVCGVRGATSARGGEQR